MTALRLIPLPIHAALEMLLGLALGIAPFALGMSTAAAFLGVIAGVLVVGLALQSIEDENPRIAAHLAADQGVALGLAAAAVIVATTGDPSAAVLFAAAAAAQLTLILATRYSTR